MNTDKNNFQEIKNEILDRAKLAKACSEQYKRAFKAESLNQLMEVIKDNFSWCCINKVLDIALIEKYRPDFSQYDIYANQNVDKGYLLCGNASVKACGNATVEAWGNATVKAWGNAFVEAYDNATVKTWGNATVEACGNATVEAYDNATVEAYDNATVEAYDNATVEAYDNAYCTSYFNIECKLADNAIYRLRSTNTVYYASDNIKFIKQNQK